MLLRQITQEFYKADSDSEVWKVKLAGRADADSRKLT
jgi:hypothetical protein